MIKWSATRINVANYCRMRYYLDYVDPDKPQPLRLSAYVRGSLLHGLIDNFWKKLGKPEEIKRDKNGKVTSKKKYSNAEEFSKHANGTWQSIIIADESLRAEYPSKEEAYKEETEGGRLINWKFEGENYSIKGNLPKVCKPLFDFVLGNRRFTGRIDDVRVKDGRVIIRDYKSGRPWVGDMKAFFDPQLTMYNVGLCSLCYQYPEMAERLGLEKEVVKTFMGNPDFVYPGFGVEFCMIDALGIDASNPKIKTMPALVVASDRKNEHFLEVLNMVKGTEEAVTTGNIYPERGRKCDDCDLKYACAKKLETVGTDEMIDKKGQGFFCFAMPAFLKENPKPVHKPRTIRRRLFPEPKK